MVPETRYAMSGDVAIAYQVVGDGPFDLVFVPPFVSNVEVIWEWPLAVRFLNRLASFSRLIMFDKRGTGLSDRVTGVPTLEQRMDDVRAVMDAVGTERAALMGVSEGCPMSILFAATYPERTTALVLYGAYAAGVASPDYPWGWTVEENQQHFDWIKQHWGRNVDLSMTPSLSNDERFKAWWVRFQRHSASPGAALAVATMNMEVDVRHVLPVVRVPTLVVCRTGDRATRLGENRYIADHIPAAKLVELPGDDHHPVVGDQDAILDEIEEFLTGVRPVPEPDRVLATVLFTDIVGSTERAAQLGDQGWRDLLGSHHSLVRRELERFRGRDVKTAGDGFLATFDGPARAVRCASSISDVVRSLGIEVRAGLHTGEIELMGEDVGGIAVHIAARVAALAGTGEVLVSRTVKDLVAGSGIRFEDRGGHVLKGVPDEWRLFAVMASGAGR